MVQAIDNAPAETRWAIATRALTGATHAESKALRDALGQDKYHEVMVQLWAEQGKASLAKSFNPKLNVTLTKARPRGDSFCEWVYELQK